MTELALPDNTAQALAQLESMGTKAEKTFAELVAGTSVVEGRTLRDKADLIGVPHIITSVSFRPVDAKNARDFVSVEAVDVNDLAIVYNDGSTGIRRQIVAYLTSHGQFPADTDPDNVIAGIKGALGESVAFEFSNDGAGIPTLAVPRGLRVSDYESEYGPARTYYLA